MKQLLKHFLIVYGLGMAVLLLDSILHNNYAKATFYLLSIVGAAQVLQGLTTASMLRHRRHIPEVGNPHHFGYNVQITVEATAFALKVHLSMFAEKFALTTAMDFAIACANTHPIIQSSLNTKRFYLVKISDNRYDVAFDNNYPKGPEVIK